MGQSAEELRREIASTREDLGGTLEAIGDRVSPGRMMERRKNRVAQGLRHARERVMGTASDAGHSVGATGHSVGEAASGAVDTLKGTPDLVRHQTKGSPLLAGAVAFGVGALAASVFKPSPLEQQATGQLMDKAQPLKDELMDAGQEMVAQMKEPARQAVEQVKDVASEGTHAVADSARSAAETGKEAAARGAAAVRTEAAPDQGQPPG